MMKNNNLIVAVLVSIAFVMLWDGLVVKRFTPPKPIVSSRDVNNPAIDQNTASTGNSTTGLDGTPVIQNDKPYETTLKADGVEVTLQSQGAKILHWRIREEDGHWVDVVPHFVKAEHYPYETYPELNFSLKSQTDREATFVVNHPDGFRLTKTISLLSQPPYHTMSLAVTNLTPAAKNVQIFVGWNGGIDKHIDGDTPDAKGISQTKAEMRVVTNGPLVQSWKAGLIMNRQIDQNVEGPFTWVGVDNNHFLSALIPVNVVLPVVHVVAERKVTPYYIAPLTFALGAKETKTQTFNLYVGPKKYSYLKTLGHGLDKAVDFGTFGFIAKTLLRMLDFYKSITNNYGWAIVLLTITIQCLMFPLTRKSLLHSVRMKELQPQIKKLQEQFKSDPKRMQVEMMNIYRKNGMKFMGMEGCFPMVLQIPVFFAFYTTLRLAYELRGAPWLWISDLGLHDPHYILPVLMGIGMFVQQRVTGVAADPAQAKMMMFMPIMMTFMFLKLPAGLVLYWSVNSLSTIVVQRILTWKKHHEAQLVT